VKPSGAAPALDLDDLAEARPWLMVVAECTAGHRLGLALRKAWSAHAWPVGSMGVTAPKLSNGVARRARLSG